MGQRNKKSSLGSVTVRKLRTVRRTVSSGGLL